MSKSNPIESKQPLLPARPRGASPPTLELACPLCKRVQRSERKFRKLYGMRICKRCCNAFINRRQVAYVIDWVAFTIISVAVFAFVDDFLDDWFYWGVRPATRLQTLLGIASPLGFIQAWVFPMLFFFKDGFSGMSPGKLLMNVQVVDEVSMEPISFGKSFKRNLVLMIPLVPLLVAFTMSKGHRWGDRWAGTRVIHRKYLHRAPFDQRGIACQSCGYDLTGNVSGICPECGTPVPEAPQAVHPITPPIVPPTAPL